MTFYAGPGPWGPGKGSPLSKGEFDNNNYSFETRITDLETSPPQPNDIVAITLTGSFLSMTQRDGTILGPVPFSPPMARWRSEWAVSTAYVAFDFVTVSEVGLFGVLQDHTSNDTAFNAGATDVDGNLLYRKVIGFSGTTATLGELLDVDLSGIGDGYYLVRDESDPDNPIWVAKSPAEVLAGLLGSTSGVLKANGSGVVSAAAAGTDYVVPGGALGTPSSGTLTNATGLPISTGVSGLGTGVATFLATPSSANLRGALTDETGTGAAVFATSPTLVTPVLGTPSSGDASNLTNIPVANATGTLAFGHGGTGQTSYTNGQLLIGNTATGGLSKAALTAGTNVTITNGNGTIEIAASGGGTPGGSSGDIQTNDGAGGFGAIVPASGIATFLATPSSANLRAALTDEVGTGAAYFVGGALGTPASGTLTNATGLPVGGIASVSNLRVLSNVSGGSASPSANTMTAILDACFGATRGMVLYRGASTWGALSAGQSGYYLQTKGNTADPVWAQVNANGKSNTTQTSTSIWLLGADYATTAALAANTYNNGTLGVGATLTGDSNGALSVDGTTPSSSDRILVKDEASGSHNGIYVVTTVGSGGAAYVLTRATDYDQAAETVQGSAVAIASGTENAGTAWVLTTSSSITIGTTSLDFEALTATLPDCTAGQVLGNPNSYTAPAIPSSLSSIIDRAIASTRGAVLYRGAGGWAALSPGTSGDVLTTAGAGGDPSWSTAGSGSGLGDVSGGSTSADGELAAYNGTGGKTLKQSFAKFSGPSASVKTYTLPNASATILTDNAAVTVAQGGTNATSASGTALDNISGFASTGVIARTGSGTYAFRTITGTSNRIALSNGDGVSGAPTIDIDSAYVGQNTITTLGTVGTGTWHGTAIAADYGGTGQASYTQGDLLYASAGTTISKLAKNTSATRYLSNTGSSNNPAWAQVDLTNGVTGILPIANGGTGLAAPPLNLIFTIETVMTNAEETHRFIPPACSFPSGAAGSSGTAGTAATGSTTLSVKKNGSAFGTFVWAGAGTSATVTISSTTSFNGSSDVLTLEGPATADTTLAKIGINLAGSRS